MIAPSLLDNKESELLHVKLSMEVEINFHLATENGTNKNECSFRQKMLLFAKLPSIDNENFVFIS